MRSNYQTVDDADPIVHHIHDGSSGHNGHDGHHVNAIEVVGSDDDADLWGVKGRSQVPTPLLAVAATVAAGIIFASIAVLVTNANVDGNRHRHPAGDDNTNATANATTACPTIIWSDEFDDGTQLDLTKWSYQDGDGCDLGICGWGNAELQVYDGESNTRLMNGSLIIEARMDEEEGEAAGAATKRYTSGKIIGRGKVDFGPVGRFEARMKLPKGNGMWPAFWMLPTVDRYGGGWPRTGEIDIMENIGKEGPNTVHGTIHYGREWPIHQYAESGITFPPETHGDFSDTFHLFAVEREPDVIRWFVDDVLYHTVTSEDIIPYDWPFDERPFFFIINLAVGGTWPGPVDNTTVFPQRMEVDHVRVYDGSFPRIEGRDEVEQFATGVTYRLVGIGGDVDVDPNITWSVPPDANITGGQGTGSITVDFGKESGIISLNYTMDDGAAPCITDGTPTPNVPGIRVNVLDDCAACIEYAFDCGCPATCTRHVLNRDADGHTCGDRIKWLIESAGKTEDEACEQIGVTEFNGICGPCKGPEYC